MALPPEDPPAGVPDWLVTYGDMMSLLLTFFVLLVSISEPKTEKKKLLVESILAQFGDMETLQKYLVGQTGPQKSKKSGKAIDPETKAKEPVQDRGLQSRRRGMAGQNFLVKTVRDGNRQTLGGPSLFESGSAELTEPAKAALLDVAANISGKFHLIEVRGYEPPAGLPPDSPFQSTTALAMARTQAVLEFLVAKGQVRRDRIRLALAAPVEAQTLPKLPTGEVFFERVDVLTMESSSRDFGRGAAPAGAQ